MMEEGKIKKGNFFFLVFLIAAAVVIGSTVGLISNVNYIVHETEMLKENSSTSNVEEEPVAETETETPDTTSQTDSTANIESSVPAAQPSNPTANPDQLDIGDDERQLLREMLYSLGMKETDNFNDFVRSFQFKNSLNATGNIDYATLNAIIQQSTMQQVSKSMNEGINS